MQSKGRELSLFILLLVAGLALANLVLVALSLLPLMMRALPLLKGGPRTAAVEGQEGGQSVWNGGVVRIKRTLKVEEGAGLVIVSDPPTPHSSPAGGSNVRVLWKGEEPIEVDVSYRLKMTRRGRYRVGPSRAILLAPTTGWEAVNIDGDNVVDVMVRDPTGDLKALSDSKMMPRLPLPHTATSMLGAQTTEFMELRNYARGDKYRNINWKATSRTTGEETWPLVNVYKIEENKSVIILLDNGPAMAVRSTGDDIFERCVRASMGLSQIYLNNRFNVGLMAIDSGETVRPGNGRRQEVLISHMLLGLELTNAGGHLINALRAFPEHIRSGPLVIIMTSLRRDSNAVLGPQIRVLRGAIGRQGKIILINVLAQETPAEGVVGDLARQLVDLGVSPNEVSLDSLGVPVHTWNPKDGDFIAFMKREFGVSA